MRVRRGIYRLVHFSASDHEDLVVLWLWSEQAGVFSHETALALHYADVAEAERMSFGAVPMTAPRRTLADCIEADFAPSLVRQAVSQARRRGLLTADDEARLRNRPSGKKTAAR